MLPPILHPDSIPAQPPRPEDQPSRIAGEGKADSTTSKRRWLSRGGAESESAAAHIHGAGLWHVLGGVLLLVGVIAFFRYLAAAQMVGGCCGGGLVVLAGLIFLVIGLRDRGDFSGS